MKAAIKKSEASKVKKLATEYICTKYPQYKGKDYEYIQSKGGAGLLKAFIYGYSFGAKGKQ